MTRLASALVSRIESRNAEALRRGLSEWILVDKMKRDVRAARRVARDARAEFDRELDTLIRRSPGLARYGSWEGVMAAKIPPPPPGAKRETPENAMTALLVFWAVVAILAGGDPGGIGATFLIVVTIILFACAATTVYYEGWTIPAILLTAAGTLHALILGWNGWRRRAA